MEGSSIRILKPGDEIALEAFLMPRVESSMFLIGNLRASGLVDRGQPYQGTYAASFEGSEIVGVAAHFWNGTLIVQAPTQLEPLWTASYRASGRPIKGLIGPAAQVEAVKTALQIDEKVVQMDETEKLYMLDLKDLIVPASLRSGQLKGRRINDKDLDLITRWRIDYSIELLKEVDGPELQAQSRASTERLMRDGHTWLVELEGQPVACSSFNTAIQEVVQVGGVWTPPALRRKGYGRAAVATSLMDAAAEGVEKSILFTGRKNIAAQKAYESLGYQVIGDYRIILLKRSITPAL